MLIFDFEENQAPGPELRLLEGDSVDPQLLIIPALGSADQLTRDERETALETAGDLAQCGLVSGSLQIHVNLLGISDWIGTTKTIYI